MISLISTIVEIVISQELMVAVDDLEDLLRSELVLTLILPDQISIPSYQGVSRITKLGMYTGLVEVRFCRFDTRRDNTPGHVPCNNLINVSLSYQILSYCTSQ